MSAQPVARRYAAALFDVATRSGSAEQAGRDLADLGRLIGEHAELRQVVASPTVPASVKKAIFAALMDKSGVASSEVRRLVSMLADRDRLELLPHVAARFTDRLNDATRVAQAEVVTAVALTPDSRAALAEALGRATGKAVTMTERVDASIIGGVVARIGTFVYDASVAGQLGRLRGKLAAEH